MSGLEYSKFSNWFTIYLFLENNIYTTGFAVIALITTIVTTTDADGSPTRRAIEAGYAEYAAAMIKNDSHGVIARENTNPTTCA
ncbi:MAG: hypothetical protein ABJA67_15575 [Chthonomonadales bacterium]